VSGVGLDASLGEGSDGGDDTGERGIEVGASDWNQQF
jgi:hypothetical protein